MEERIAPWISTHNIRAVPDFPKPGIIFRDITPLLHSPEAFEEAVATMLAPWKEKVDIIAGLDARGFIFGIALAQKLRLPFMMIRKKGKLPGRVESIDYGLEYGQNTLEVATDSLPPGTNVLVVDDLLATGGSAKAAATLIQRIGLTVAGYAFAIELEGLGGRAVLGSNVTSVLKYP